MITIEQRGENLLKVAQSSDSRFITMPHNTIIINGDICYISYAVLTGKLEPINRTQQLIKPNTTYTLSYTKTNLPSTFIIQIETYDREGLRIHAYYAHTSPYTFTSDPSAYSFDMMLYTSDHTIISNGILASIQLEEGSVATPYEDPWVNTLTFDDNLHAGEFLQKSKGIFYIHKNWYRDEQNNPYEQLTFTNGVATPSAITSEPVIVEDISTGEIKNAMVSGSAVNVYLNQYDSWDVTNSTTTAFTLNKTTLKPDFPVAINGTVTTSGFTTSTTQIVFDNAVASGSSVSCVYPYLDTGYNLDAKVFYQTAPKDEVISPVEATTYKKANAQADLPSAPEIGDTYLVMEKGSFYLWTGSKWQVIGGGAPALIVGDESTVTTTSTTYTSVKTLTLIQSSFITFAKVVARITLKTSAGTVYARLGADSDTITSTEVSTTSTSEVAEEITLDVSTLGAGTHSIDLEMHVDDSANTGTNVVFELWGVPA